MMKRPTYTSFMPIRDWTKNIPSTSTNRPTSAATSRRRNRIRVRRYRQRRRDRTGDDAGQPPGEGVIPEVDRRRGAVAGEQEELLAVRRRVVGLDVARPGARARTPRAAARRRRRRCRAVRPRTPSRRPMSRSGSRVGFGEAEDVDLLARCVIGHPRPGTRQGMLAHAVGAVLGRIATDGDDVVARVRRRRHW